MSETFYKIAFSVPVHFKITVPPAPDPSVCKTFHLYRSSTHLHTPDSVVTKQIYCSASDLWPLTVWFGGVKRLRGHMSYLL